MGKITKDNSSRILAVVVKYNLIDMMNKCISHLLVQTEIGFEILIINNHSTDDTEHYLSKIGNERILHITTEGNIGGAGGFNLGLKYAAEQKYEYAWLMDDDVLAEEDALSELMHAAREIGEFGYLAGRVLDMEGKQCLMNIPKYKKTKSSYENFPSIRASSFVSFFIPIHTVIKVGLPIKDFFIWGDDIEYSMRISSQLPCYEVLSSKVQHNIVSTNGSSIALDKPDRIDRYYFAYRNENYLYRMQGFHGVMYYFAKCILNFGRIILWGKPNRKKRIEILYKGITAGFKFNPTIEYVS